MEKRIIDFIDTNPLISGLIFIIIGALILVYKLNKKDSVKFGDSNILAWRAHVFTLAIIIMLFIFGLISIFRGL